jgi:hypothetical protein
MAHLIGAMMDGSHPQTTKQEINFDLDTVTMNRVKKNENMSLHCLKVIEIHTLLY